jgi:hypothetical protein
MTCDIDTAVCSEDTRFRVLEARHPGSQRAGLMKMTSDTPLNLSAYVTVLSLK